MILPDSTGDVGDAADNGLVVRMNGAGPSVSFSARAMTRRGCRALCA